MHIVFPVTIADIEEARLCECMEATSYCLVEIDENAEIVEIDFTQEQQAACERAEYFVIERTDKKEHFLFEYPFKPLIAPSDSSIDEIIEGYRFCELHEVH